MGELDDVGRMSANWGSGERPLAPGRKRLKYRLMATAALRSFRRCHHRDAHRSDFRGTGGDETCREECDHTRRRRRAIAT